MSTQYLIEALVELEWVHLFLHRLGVRNILMAVPFNGELKKLGDEQCNGGAAVVQGCCHTGRVHLNVSYCRVVP
jgi:hypothetical protein